MPVGAPARAVCGDAVSVVRVSFMANPAFRPDSEGRTLKDNDIIQGFFTWSGPDPDCRTRKLGTSDRHPSLDLGSPFRTLVGCVSL